LYDEKFSSMDEMGGFEPEETSGFISVSAIRLKAWANAKYVPYPSPNLTSAYPFVFQHPKGQGRCQARRRLRYPSIEGVSVHVNDQKRLVL
jgi:hypothetical protein